jgi:endonuclease I
VYCRKKVTEGHVGPGQIPNHQVINAEHTWPQSRFNKSHSNILQKSDLHALFPALSKVNSSRGNLELAWVDQPVGKPSCDGVYRGHNNSSGNKLYFEPRDEHKGDAARALFYFSTRYNLRIGSTEEKSLRDWHQLDPVDSIERERHEEVFHLQKVRNPFIDHPELTDIIRDF